MIPRKFAAALAFLLILPLAGCREEDRGRQEVLRLIGATARQPREFVYTEEANGNTVKVSGRVQDSFRFDQTLSVNATEAMQRVVTDDAMSVRIISVGHIPSIAEGQSAPGGSIIVSDALKAGQWVTDPSGAPSFFALSQTDESNVGADPMRDSVDVLNYVKVSIAQAFDVAQWQERDLFPAYNRKVEDHFPPPDSANGERRFDLFRPGVPRPQTSGGGVGGIIRTSQFRKMAIYAKGGLITRILEEIDVEGHYDFYEARQRGEETILQVLDTIKEGKIQERIRPRKMSIIFSGVGTSMNIRAPEGALQATLRGLFEAAGSSTAGLFGTGGGGYGPTAGSVPLGGAASTPAPETSSPGSGGDPEVSPAPPS